MRASPRDGGRGGVVLREMIARLMNALEVARRNAAVLPQIPFRELRNGITEQLHRKRLEIHGTQRREDQEP